MSALKRSAPSTPLRRISRGSLNALSHSRGPPGATPLSFLERAMADLVDETSVLQANLEQMEAIHTALGTFNESFAMYIYGLKMNAYCVEWPEAPQEENFERAQQRFAQQAEQVAAQQQLQSALQHTPQFGDDMSMYAGSSAVGGGIHPADQTYVTQDDESFCPTDPAPAKSAQSSQPPKSALKSALKKPTASSTTSAAKPAPKGKITLVQKRKREAYTDEIIETLPLEYRGNDPKANGIAKGVIMVLISSGTKGARIAEIVNPPDLTQAKVNKTLIALVAAKHVTKISNNGIIYTLDPQRHPSLP